MDANTAFIIFIIIFVIIYVVADKVVGIASNKADDAISNAWARFKNSKNPPQERSLAEIYGNQTTSSANSNASSQIKEASDVPAGAQPTQIETAPINASTVKFCRKCGASLPESAKFCRKCGNEVSTD